MITRRQLMQNAALLAAGPLARAWAAARASHPVGRANECVGNRSHSLRYFPWRAGPDQEDWLCRLRDRVFELAAAIQVPRGRPATASPRAALPFSASTSLFPWSAWDPATHFPLSPCIKRWRPAALRSVRQRLIFSGAPAATTDDLKRKIAGLNTAGAFSKSAWLAARLSQPLVGVSIEGG